MVNEFSDYARPCKMSPRPLCLDDFVSEVMDLYASGEHEVCFEPGAPGAMVEADPVRLRQVLHNLVKNALESRPDGDVRVCLRTATLNRRGRDWVELEIEDDGEGFDPALIDQVFEPYVTSKQKGTGLGLAIVKRIVGEHGGNIRAENLPGGGARLSIMLPRRQGGAQPNEQQEAGSQPGEMV